MYEWTCPHCGFVASVPREKAEHVCPRTKVSHTPGPWIARQMKPVNQYDEDLTWEVISAENDWIVEGATEIDARLIAKAPEMREMVEALLAGYEPLDANGEQLIGEARALLAEIDGGNG